MSQQQENVLFLLIIFFMKKKQVKINNTLFLPLSKVSHQQTIQQIALKNLLQISDQTYHQNPFYSTFDHNLSYQNKESNSTIQIFKYPYLNNWRATHNLTPKESITNQKRKENPNIVHQFTLFNFRRFSKQGKSKLIQKGIGLCENQEMQNAMNKVAQGKNNSNVLSTGEEQIKTLKCLDKRTKNSFNEPIKYTQLNFTNPNSPIHRIPDNLSNQKIGEDRSPRKYLRKVVSAKPNKYKHNIKSLGNKQKSQVFENTIRLSPQITKRCNKNK